jgi:hypothetical protein
MTTTFADGEQAGENNGHGDDQRTAICLPSAGRPGDYTPGRSPFCPACGQPFAEHLSLVGTCSLYQQAKQNVALLEQQLKAAMSLSAQCLAVLEELKGLADE